MKRKTTIPRPVNLTKYNNNQKPDTMKTSFINNIHHVVLPCAAILAIGVSSASATLLLEDNFSTLDTTKWFATSAATTSYPAPDDGKMLFPVNGASSAYRSLLVSSASNFNPFEYGEISITVTGLTIGGTPGTGGNEFYVLLGNVTTSDNQPATGGAFSGYHRGRGSLANAGYLSVGIVRREGGIQLVYDDRGSSASSSIAPLNAVPTGFTWTIDSVAKTWTITLEGATFTGIDGSVSLSKSFINCTEASLANGSWIAIGAMNNGDVTSATTASVDAIIITATAIPEKASTAALLCGLTLIIVVCFCKRRSPHVGNVQ